MRKITHNPPVVRIDSHIISENISEKKTQYGITKKGGFF